MDEMFGAATMVTAFLICLGFFHHPHQSDHELLGHPLDSTGIITLWVFASSASSSSNAPSGWQVFLKVVGYP